MPHPFANLGPAIIGALGDPSPVTLSRFGTGSYVNGEWVSGPVTVSTLPAVIQPLKPREVAQLPEAERTEEVIAVFTSAALQTSTPSGLEADRLTWAGRVWRVILVEDWTAQAGYARAVAVRLAQ
jgi:hypothetical protein